jgi:hypothetical protein
VAPEIQYAEIRAALKDAGIWVAAIFGTAAMPRAVFKSVNGIAAVREPASGIAVANFADDLREGLIKCFPCAGLHAA